VVTIDLPDDEERTARARRKPEARVAKVRPARPAPPPVGEVARQEKPARRPAAAPAPTPAPASRLEPEPEPVPLPPPPVAAAPPAEAPGASAPLAIGTTVARGTFQKPRTSTPGCVASSIRMPQDVADIGGTTATVRFSVDEAGKVSQFSYLSGPDDRAVGNAIWTAIRRCDWTPGANAEGVPLAQWVTMPIRFGK
jgi:protein TonB